jgi:hypothetical protein
MRQPLPYLSIAALAPHLAVTIGCTIVLAVMFATSNTFAGPRDAMVINSELEPEFLRIISISDEYVEVAVGGRSRAMPLDRFLAILFTTSDVDAVEERDGHGLLHGELRPDQSTGRLHLADGQRYVGRLIADSALPSDTVTWSHPLLGRLEFKLDDVRAVTLPNVSDTTDPNAYHVEPDIADRVILRNGDELRGFIVSISDPIEIEFIADDGSGDGRIVELPMDRVASVKMIAPRRPAVGKRLWLADGTIMAVQSLSMPERGNIEVTGRWHGTGTQTSNLPRDSIAAVLFDARRLVPLSSIAPARVEGPPTRYLVSDPVILDTSSMLGISRIEYRGPLTVYYTLPEGASRFAAVATLPRESRTWGDFELVIRIDGREVDRRSINADRPTAAINLELHGRELTIELLEGDSGPVQNHLILSRAMVLLAE